MYNKTELDKLRDNIKEQIVDPGIKKLEASLTSLNSSVAVTVSSLNSAKGTLTDLQSSMDDEKAKLEILKRQVSSYHQHPRLIGGTKDSEGNVFIDGKPVCDDYWNLNNAKVVCRQLGFKNTLRFTSNSEFGSVPDNFIMDDVYCRGSENTLGDCHHSSYDDCRTTEGAGVVCSDPFPVSIKLIGGDGEGQGNVYVDGQPVCDDNWDTYAGRVACRQLGYDGFLEITSESAFGQVPDTFVIDDIRCNGNEARLIDCPHSSTDDCSAGEGAGVKCY